MATLVIRLLKGYANGHIDLSDNGHTRARKLDTIIWQIAPGSGIKNIESIEEKKSSNEDIFEPGHPYRQGGHWKGDIKRDATDYVQYKYSIHWKDTSSTSREYDPIISIRPSTGPGPIARILIAILTALLGIFTFKYFQQKKNRR